MNLKNSRRDQEVVEGSTPTLVSQISTLLKRRRQALNLTLQEVGERIDFQSAGAMKISISQLSRFENGLLPSIEQVHWLNEVLDRPLGLLFAAQKPKPFFVVRAEKSAERLEKLIAGELKNARSDDAHASKLETLSGSDDDHYLYAPLQSHDGKFDDDYISANDRGTSFPQFMQAYLFRVRPAATKSIRNDNLSSHAGEELIYVLSGEMEFLSEGTGPRPDTCKLIPGDSLHFQSELPHAFRAIGSEPAVSLFVYTRPPNVKPSPEVVTTKPEEPAQ